MATFVFPDPNVQSTVTNPATGEQWIYQDGLWQLVSGNQATQETPDSTTVFIYNENEQLVRIEETSLTDTETLVFTYDNDENLNKIDTYSDSSNHC